MKSTGIVSTGGSFLSLESVHTVASKTRTFLSNCLFRINNLDCCNVYRRFVHVWYLSTGNVYIFCIVQMLTDHMMRGK